EVRAVEAAAREVELGELQAQEGRFGELAPALEFGDQVFVGAAGLENAALAGEEPGPEPFELEPVERRAEPFMQDGGAGEEALRGRPLLELEIRTEDVVHRRDDEGRLALAVDPLERFEVDLEREGVLTHVLVDTAEDGRLLARLVATAERLVAKVGPAKKDDRLPELPLVDRQAGEEAHDFERGRVLARPLARFRRRLGEQRLRGRKATGPAMGVRRFGEREGLKVRNLALRVVLGLEP